MARIYYVQLEEGESLCDTCKFAHKCARYQTIVQTLDILESTVFNQWALDLNTDFAVNQCNLYRYDPMISEG